MDTSKHRSNVGDSVSQNISLYNPLYIQDSIVSSISVSPRKMSCYRYYTLENIFRQGKRTLQGVTSSHIVDDQAHHIYFTLLSRSTYAVPFTNKLTETLVEATKYIPYDMCDMISQPYHNS